MSQLQLSLLGEPLVKHDDRTLTFSTRKALAMLVYLAVEGGLHTRKALSEAFWPELDAERGRAALRATLLELRRLFERSHGPGERDHLRIEHDLLGIEQDDSLLVDLRLVASASKLAGRGSASLAGQGRDEVIQQLERASRLVRGPFLAGFTLRDSQFFDDWSSQHREHWHRRVYQVFDALSMLYEQGGEVERAIETVIRWLSFDPLNEEGYRRLMRLRFSQGDRAGALRAYSRCRSVLAEELQVEPEPETVAQAKLIRHTAPLRPDQVRPAQASPGQPPANLLDGPFLGRTAEFGTLIERYQHVHAGQPQLVLIQGESGIGKTRLASEFVRWAQAQGANVLVGKALQTGSELPYQPLIEVLRNRLEQDHGSEGHLGDVWLAELARLLPELRERYPDLPVPAIDETFGNNRLFEATARLIRKWAAQRPLVLLLEDMQWADTATLDLLLYLARSLAEQPAPVLLLFNLNTDPGGCAAAQAGWQMSLKRMCLPLTGLRLIPFTQEETRRFVQELAWAEQPVEMDCTGSTWASADIEEAPGGRPALLSFSDWLYRQTSGQPLYVRETFNELIARGILYASLRESGAWGLVLRAEMLTRTPEGELIPPALRELIRARLGRLSPSAWTLLVTASVLSAGLSFERLCQVAGLEELEGVRALEELLSGGWLSEATALAESPVCDGYGFPRELIRQVVYQEAGITRRRVVQRRLTALIRAGIADEQDEETLAPRATAGEEHTRTGKRTGPGLAGTLSSRPGSLWKTRKEERDALRTTYTATKHVPGATSPGWHPGQASPGG